MTQRLGPAQCGRSSPCNALQPPVRDTGRPVGPGKAREHVAIPAFRIGAFLAHERDPAADNLLKSDPELLFSGRRCTIEYDAKYFETFRATVACNACSACRGRIAIFTARIPVSGPRLVDHRRCRTASDTHSVGTPAG